MKKSELVKTGMSVKARTVSFILYVHPQTRTHYWVIGTEYWPAADGWPRAVDRLQFDP